MQRTSRLAHPSELTNVLLRLVVLPKNILQCTSSRLKIKKININILIAKEGLESLQPPWLHLWQGPQLITNIKRSHLIVVLGNNVWRKIAFFQN